MTYEEFKALMFDAKNARGADAVRAVIKKHHDGSFVKARDIAEERYAEIALDLQALIGYAVCGYAYSSTVSPADNSVPVFTVHGAAIVDRYPGREDKVIHPCAEDMGHCFRNEVPKHAMHGEIDHSGSSMSTYYIGLPGDLDSETTMLVINTANLMGQKLMAAQEKRGVKHDWMSPHWSEEQIRMEAFLHLMKGDPRDVINYMAFLLFRGESCAPAPYEIPQWQTVLGVTQEQQATQLDNDTLRLLIERMEERHGEEFNAFFEATIRQVMIGSGMTELRIDTNALQTTILQGGSVHVREVPGFLIYELVEDSNGVDGAKH